MKGVNRLDMQRYCKYCKYCKYWKILKYIEIYCKILRYINGPKIDNFQPVTQVWFLQMGTPLSRSPYFSWHIQTLPEKLDSICDMPKPRSPKKIKKFLGLTGYYRKFVLRFSDMARPLTELLAHDCEFVWTDQCDISFQMLKDTLCSAPILKYPDTTKLYTLYTDASKYRWAGVLTQRHTSTIDGKEITMDHPVSYVSGLFRGSQLNWAALTKEAYAIYMSVKNLLFI